MNVDSIFHIIIKASHIPNVGPEMTSCVTVSSGHFLINQHLLYQTQVKLLATFACWKAGCTFHSVSKICGMKFREQRGHQIWLVKNTS